MDYRLQPHSARTVEVEAALFATASRVRPPHGYPAAAMTLSRLAGYVPQDRVTGFDDSGRRSR
jgi:hypothetical protein